MAKTTTAPKQAAPAAAAATQIPGATENAAALISRNTGLAARMAARFGIDPDKLLETLKQTAFRQRPRKENGRVVEEAKPVTNEQLLMLLVVAEEYSLNPFTRDLYAFPQDGGITPIISVDGWLRITHQHPQFKSMEFRYPNEDDGAIDPDDYWVEVIIERKDHEKPFIVREYLKECYRDTDPWNTMPKRMNRHKAIIQCARVAFGFAGIYDPDEAERIYAAAIDVTPRGKARTEPPRARVEPPIDVPQNIPEKTVSADQNTQPAAQSGNVGNTNSLPPEQKPTAISFDQATFLSDALKEEGIALSLFLAKFEIGRVEDLPLDKYSNATAWILAPHQ